MWSQLCIFSKNTTKINGRPGSSIWLVGTLCHLYTEISHSMYVSCRLLFFTLQQTSLLKVELLNLLACENSLLKLSPCIVKATAGHALVLADCWCSILFSVLTDQFSSGSH